MNIKFPAQCPKLHARNKIKTWLSWILSLSVKLKQISTWCKVVRFENRTPNDEENMQVKHMIKLSYRKRCSLGHRKRTRSNSNINVQLRSCGRCTWKCRTQFVSNVQAQQVASWCVNWNGLDSWNHGWIPTSTINQGITLRSRAKFRMELRQLTGFHQIPLSNQIRFKVDTQVCRIPFDFPTFLTFFFWEAVFFLMTHRGLVSTCHPDLSVVVFFSPSIHRFFAVSSMGFSQVLGESFPEVLALQSNDEKLVKVGHAAEGFFFSLDVVGWLVGAFMGRKGDLMWELFFLFKRRYVLLL